VTFSGNAYLPTLSPDGKQLATARLACPRSVVAVPGGDGCTYGVVVEDLATGDARALTEGLDGLDFLAWSPDQRYLLMNATRGEDRGTWRVSSLGGREQLVTAEHWPGFLGSADSIVVLPFRYNALDGNTRRATRWLMVLTAEGVTADSIPFRVPGIQPLPSPSPDGARILLWQFAGREHPLYLIDRAGRLTDSITLPWGYDGQRGPPRWTADGGGLEVLAPADSGSLERWFLLRYEVSADGRVRLPPDTLTPPLLVPGRPDQAGGFSFSSPSRDGDIAIAMRTQRRILVTLERPSPLAPPSRRDTLVTATGSLDGVVSPDGQRVLVVRRAVRDGRPAAQLEVMPFDGGPASPLGPPVPGLRSFSWSGDGRTIYRVAAAAAPGLMEHAAIEIATGRARLLRTFADTLPIEVDQDSLVLFRSPGSDPAGLPLEWRVPGRPTTSPALFTFPDTADVVNSAALFHDGQGSWTAAVIARYTSPDSREWPERVWRFGLYVARPGTPATRVAALAGPWWWLVIQHVAPGPSFELVARVKDGALERVLIEPGRPPRSLGRMPVPLRPNFSADGRRGVVAEDIEVRTDVWLMRRPSEHGPGPPR
jgi:hypothetical protein